VYDEMKHTLSDGSADTASVKFTTVAFCMHTHLKMLAPLINCIVNGALVHAVPNVQQTFLQYVNAVQLRLMHLFRIYSSFQRWKNFENQLGFDKVIAISWWSTFLGHSVYSTVSHRAVKCFTEVQYRVICVVNMWGPQHGI